MNPVTIQQPKRVQGIFHCLLEESSQKCRIYLSRHFPFQLESSSPPPNILDQYDKIVPGGAKRIMATADSETKHRRECEKTVVGVIQRGQSYALTIVLFGMALATICFLVRPGLPAAILGSVLCGVPLSGILISRIWGWTRSAVENNES